LEIEAAWIKLAAEPVGISARLVRGSLKTRWILNHWDDLLHEADVAHLWPARYAHINPYGKYRFNVEGEFHRKGLRPLRLSDSELA
jgi:hypothetical protein